METKNDFSITKLLLVIIALLVIVIFLLLGWKITKMEFLGFELEPPATSTPGLILTPTVVQYEEQTNIPSATATSPTITQAATQSPVLIHNETVSPDTLARIVGGDAAYWKQVGPVVWVYSNKDHNVLMQHPGDNMILTYWAGFGDPQNADDCQIIISPANSLEKYVKCPSGTNAQIVVDQVGLHLIDYTGYFP